MPEETQLAVYGARGDYYRPHRDGHAPRLSEGPLTWLRLRSVRHRVLTGILYLSDNAPDSPRPWHEDDGGCLRLYLSGPGDGPGGGGDGTGGRAEPAFVDIPPVGGRLVVFDSQTVLHEVLPSFRERAAITVWFLVR